MSIASAADENARLRQPLLDALAAARVDLDVDELNAAVQDVLRLRQSLASLGPAMQHAPAVPAGVARIAQATENAWRRIDEEFGLLSGPEVALRLGARSSNRTLANVMRRDGRLLAVRRLNAYRYPGFQFLAGGALHPAIPDLVTLAAEVDWPHHELILWLCAPSGAFDGDRPVDHLGDDALLDRARASATVDW